ncbi:nucleotidyltransferase domain-containing protein [Clostridium cagae]|uniref:nucleotidyltransferase domain-containing protein n=1 Tax=Clostridium cagae TaxID=2080751 RepID=UPI003F769FAD
MKKEYIKDLKIDDTDNIIALAVFGSYNTENFIENRSDIDILILLNERRGVEFEFKLEDKLLSKLEDFFSYDNIHITFLYLNEFDSDLAKCYIESKNKIILDFNKEIDFRLYVNKYLRNNEWLNELIKHDTELLNGRK